MKPATCGLPALVLSLSLVLAGCATPLGQPLGRPLAQVTAELGAPTARYKLPGGGVRLQYSQQPEGRHVYNLDFDAAGHLLRREDAMQPRAFEAIEPGRWAVADLEFAFGKPAATWRVARSGTPVWSWRFEDAGVWRWLHVSLDAQSNQVQEWSTADEDLPDLEARAGGLLLLHRGAARHTP